MKKIYLDEIKKNELGLLIEIDEICRNNEIKYSLAGGTLLGAVRHKGFIPWDDDIDIFMERKEYDKFLQIINKKTNAIGVINCRSNRSFAYTFSKVYDKNTLIMDEFGHKGKYDIGVYIDIFPVDYCSNSFGMAKCKTLTFNVLKYILVAAIWPQFTYNRTYGVLRNFVRFLFYLLTRCIDANKFANKLDKLYSKERPVRFSVSYSGVYGVKEIFETKMFKDFVSLEFEGHFFQAIKNYDKYLSSLYGDYMVPPPIEKRFSRHGIVAYKIN